jgi:hypothetical protein
VDDTGGACECCHKEKGPFVLAATRGWSLPGLLPKTLEG